MGGRGWSPALWFMCWLVIGLGGSLTAQRIPFTAANADEYTPDGSENKPYDGRVQFVRLRYRDGMAAFGRGGLLSPWAHDYPRADSHLMMILNELTLLRPRTTGSNVFSLDDELLTAFPLAYMSEPGYWQASETEARGLRDYLLKGGFIVFDDFRARDWDNLQVQMRRVLPDHVFVELDGTHPVFHSFFEIPDPQVLEPPYGGLKPAYFGIYEKNDPHGRLMAVANLNNDLGEYWEFSDTGFMPVDLSNEAYKFGVNYAMYALTH